MTTSCRTPANKRLVDLNPGLKRDPKDDESDNGEVAARFAEGLRAEEFSIVQVEEVALTTEQVQKLERR